MSEPTHAFMPCDCPPSTTTGWEGVFCQLSNPALCHFPVDHGAPRKQACGLSRSAHPEPAPESAEPKCCCLEFWQSHPPDCPRVLAGLEKAGVEPANEPLRRLAEEWLATQVLRMDPGRAASLTRLLERVVRECAEASCECGDPECSQQGYVLRHFDLSPESAPERKEEPDGR